MRLRTGDWVEVRSAAEVLATLDKSGELDAMPFMVEMLQYCGQRLQVEAIAHKTCDTICGTGGRRVTNAVHLKRIRCDGSAHGGCQAGCLIFWKKEWLKPASETAQPEWKSRSPSGPALTVEQLRAAGARTSGAEPIYSCQATRLFAATRPLPWWDLRQYAQDLWSGNVGVGRFLRVITLRTLYHLRKLGIGYRLSIALHDAAHKLLTGRPTPYLDGLIPVGQPTPTETLNLAVGEWVQLRSLDEIRGTTNERNFNRGMRFDPEMAQFCDRSFRVARRVERIIDERTGRMRHMKSACIVLEAAACSADYSAKRLFCPRAIDHYFREIWLRRVDAPGVHAISAESDKDSEAV
jgi:hypothetical protein